MSTNQQEFLLTHFHLPHTKYAAVEVNGFILVRTINGATGDPVVMVYTEQSFQKAQKYLKPEKAITKDIPLYTNKKLLPTAEDIQLHKTKSKNRRKRR